MNFKETLLYRVLDNSVVECGICYRKCRIIPDKRGYCSTRINKNGKLYSLNYGQVTTYRAAPIEIKPLFHFYPGSYAFSLGSWGCNFRCIGCQNWEIAHAVDATTLAVHNCEYISPEKAIDYTIELDCQGISWTYNEPTLWFEYTLDCAKLAKRYDLYTNYVTNGYITSEALDIIGPYLDAFRVDVKGFTSGFYRRIAEISEFYPILDVTERAKKKWGMHVEVITNVIPGYNDEPEQLEKIAIWICNKLGEDTPWHITRFVPHLKLSHLPYTSVQTLEQAYQIGLSAGLRYVYLGNVPGHNAENTYCPECTNLLIKRANYQILEYHIVDKKCRFCNTFIPITGEYRK